MGNGSSEEKKPLFLICLCFSLVRLETLYFPYLGLAFEIEKIRRLKEKIQEEEEREREKKEERKAGGKRARATEERREKREEREERRWRTLALDLVCVEIR